MIYANIVYIVNHMMLGYCEYLKSCFLLSSLKVLHVNIRLTVGREIKFLNSLTKLGNTVTSFVFNWEMVEMWSHFDNIYFITNSSFIKIRIK